MDSGPSRVAQVFIWKQGSAPDLNYARQVLSVVNPDAFQAIRGEDPPVQLLTVTGPWPEDPWARALLDMRAIPAPDDTRWTDTTQYELSGWQGTDQRTSGRIFVVTAFRRAPATPAETFKGEDVQAPPYTQPPTAPTPEPFYRQYPTGPLSWQQTEQAQGQRPPASYSYGQQEAQPQQYSGYGPQGSYPYSSGQAPTGPLSQLPVPTGGVPYDAARLLIPDSYAPFYSGFGERLAAALIDFFFMVLFQVPTIAFGFLWLPGKAVPADFSGWAGLYGPFACMGLLIFTGYFVICWSAAGRTIGMRMMRIHVVGADGLPPGIGRSLLRMIGYVFSAAIAFWGFLMIALDSKRQGLHDKIAETYVVPDSPPMSAPPGIPGYRSPAGMLPAPSTSPQAQSTTYSQSGGPALPAIGMANVAGTQPYTVVRMPREEYERPQYMPPSRQPGLGGATAAGHTEPIPSVRPHEADRPERRLPFDTGPVQAEEAATQEQVTPSGGLSSSGIISPLDPMTEEMLAEIARNRTARPGDIEAARSLFKSGVAELERGVRRGYLSMEIEPTGAARAARLFHEALELVPNAVAYRYYYAVALRYSEGFEVAIGEFRRVLELDPGHFEAGEQVAYGPRWHDAFTYPVWGDPPPAELNMPLPEPVRVLLPQPHRPGTRLVLLREGSSKMVVALSRTRRDTWAHLPTPAMAARVELILQRTPQGPIIAFYVVVRDDPDNPYKGETFLNPHDPGQPSDDACQLGQHMLAQLARQDHTFLIFVDEHDNLLLSRKLVFDAATQVNIARVHYEVQTLPPQIMDVARFQQAAQWHMDNFSLDQIKPQ